LFRHIAEFATNPILCSITQPEFEQNYVLQLGFVAVKAVKMSLEPRKKASPVHKPTLN
jgi:hypothetical protein